MKQVLARAILLPPAGLRFGKVHAINEQAYGWWITDDGRLVEVDSARHGEAAFRDIVQKRGVNTQGAPAGVSIRDFAMEYMGWIRLVNQNDLLEIECWNGRVAKRAYDALAKFIGATYFTDYSLDVRVKDPGAGGAHSQVYEAEDVKRMLAFVRRNVVQQIMPQMVAAARRRILAYQQANTAKFARSGIRAA